MNVIKTQTALKILLTVDESSYMDAAISLLTHIQWPSRTSTYVLPVAADTTCSRPTLCQVLQPAVTTTKPGGQTVIHALAAQGGSRIPAYNLIAEAESAAGYSISMVLDRAKKLAADLIIIGMREEVEPQAFQLSATATNILQYAPQSVLVARPQEHIRPLRTILAVDGSPQTERVLEFACQLSLPNWASITVVTVAEENGTAAATATTSARAVVKQLRDCGVQSQINILHGPAADKILLAAQTQQASLIVMGAHSRTELAPSTYLGHVARQVIQTAPCSVLVVR